MVAFSYIDLVSKVAAMTNNVKSLAPQHKNKADTDIFESKVV